jgi:hypothetical protein
MMMTPHLTSLSLNNCAGVDDAAAPALASALAALPGLASLSLSGTGMGSAASWAGVAAALVDIDTPRVQLTSLCLSYNELTGPAFKYLAAALPWLPCLERLDLCYTNFGYIRGDKPALAQGALPIPQT